MTIVAELTGVKGVFAAGEYSYRGDRFSYRGELDEEQARMASIMCRATTMGVHMQADILSSYCDDCAFSPARGWIVRGPAFTVCAMANVFCFMESATGSVNEVMGLMYKRLSDAEALV
ncbi:MAG TPA: DUF2173 family protein [Gammaproteobacteria bacterium]|nr:DUF2173 family protein [Gammaproteobacteria bacterium]